MATTCGVQWRRARRRPCRTSQDTSGARRTSRNRTRWNSTGRSVDQVRQRRRSHGQPRFPLKSRRPTKQLDNARCAANLKGRALLTRRRKVCVLSATKTVGCERSAPCHQGLSATVSPPSFCCVLAGIPRIRKRDTETDATLTFPDAAAQPQSVCQRQATASGQGNSSGYMHERGRHFDAAQLGCCGELAGSTCYERCSFRRSLRLETKCANPVVLSHGARRCRLTNNVLMVPSSVRALVVSLFMCCLFFSQPRQRNCTPTCRATLQRISSCTSFSATRI